MNLKQLNEYKLGEICSEELMKGCMQPPNKCVAIAYTFQSKDGTKLVITLKHDDFIEDEKENRDD